MLSVNKKYNYKDKAIIEPAGVIDERRKIGLHPSSEVPAGAILCYDSALWKFVTEIPDAVECDGWLKGYYLVTKKDRKILITKVPGFGAPAAAMLLEELIAYGIKKFVNIGTAGGLQDNLKVGDIVICDRAIRDEGTSYHYLPDDLYSYACPDLTDMLTETFMKMNIPYFQGISWTTDAPYRETIQELRHYKAEGVMTVEMEASALFAVGSFRKVHVSSAFTISDLIKEDGWHQGYHSNEKLFGLMRIFEASIEILTN